MNPHLATMYTSSGRKSSAPSAWPRVFVVVSMIIDTIDSSISNLASGNSASCIRNISSEMWRIDCGDGGWMHGCNEKQRKTEDNFSSMYRKRCPNERGNVLECRNRAASSQMRASHFQPATGCLRCPSSSQRTDRTGARAAATLPADASHSPGLCPSSGIRPILAWIGRVAPRAGNRLRRASPNSFSCRSWTVAYFASRFAGPLHVILSCTKWNFQYFAKTLMRDRWPVSRRTRRLSRPVQLHRLLCFVDDLRNKKKWHQSNLRSGAEAARGRVQMHPWTLGWPLVFGRSVFLLRIYWYYIKKCSQFEDRTKSHFWNFDLGILVALGWASNQFNVHHRDLKKHFHCALKAAQLQEIQMLAFRMGHMSYVREMNVSAQVGVNAGSLRVGVRHTIRPRHDHLPLKGIFRDHFAASKWNVENAICYDNKIGCFPSSRNTDKNFTHTTAFVTFRIFKTLAPPDNNRALDETRRRFVFEHFLYCLQIVDFPYVWACARTYTVSDTDTQHINQLKCAMFGFDYGQNTLQTHSIAQVLVRPARMPFHSKAFIKTERWSMKPLLDVYVSAVLIAQWSSIALRID